MSHITGTVQSSAINLGPDFGPATNPPDSWLHNFAHDPPPIGVTKLLMLHFRNVSLPANNRLEVDLGYGTDVFTAADGAQFWTRPINVYVLPGGLVPIRYIRNGAPDGGVQVDRYGRGEQHAGESNHPSVSNCDPFLKDAAYAEPTYDPFWFCANPPNWENAACVTDSHDVRARVARSVGMILSAEGSDFTGIEQLSTCSVTLVDTDKVLTAGHCHTPEEAPNSSIIFGYEVNCDGSKPPSYNVRVYKVKAVLSHHYDSVGDFSLLQLAEAVTGIPAVQMRHDIPKPDEQVFGIHHPNGAVKKLSLPHPGFDTVLASSPGAINVHSNFHVSGGSSGSGLFDTAGRIVGVLSNGSPCASASSPLTYFPTASILRAIAPAPPPPIERDVMVVLDRSGSMSANDASGRPKIEAARDAASLFIELVRSNTGNRAGLVSFSTTAVTDFDLNVVNPDNKSILVGPPPFAGGRIGALLPGGFTSIGEALDAARVQFPAPGVNPRAILLLTDGMQNTPRMIAEVEGLLAGIDIHAVGFGTDANLDGPLLTALTTAHNGVYTRAESGLALEKFFSTAFGNIFEAGILMDPESDLPANEFVGSEQTFRVCGEETLTVVAGWDRTDATLGLEAKTPGGISITAGSAGVEAASGRSWAFLRIPLPHGGERDGVWNVRVLRPRGQDEFRSPAPQLRYFINIIPTGGPRLLRKPDNRRYYTGDRINPRVWLRYANGGWPENVEMHLTLSRPDTGVGNILSKAKLREAVTTNGDTIPARQATLAALEKEAGRPLIRYRQETMELFDDSLSTDGGFEAAALFGKPLPEILDMEGNYEFHFRATYGEGCVSSRELVWSLHVDVGVDPSRSTVTTTDSGARPDGKHEILVSVTPRDRYGNNLGPGRADGIVITSTPGTTVTGAPQDGGDGSYTVPGVWDPSSSYGPGMVIGQPGRPGAVIQLRTATLDCRKWKLLVWVLLMLLLLLLIILFLK
jgi:V8-like Glu-specific endopeptidase